MLHLRLRNSTQYLTLFSSLKHPAGGSETTVLALYISLMSSDNSFKYIKLYSEAECYLSGEDENTHIRKQEPSDPLLQGRTPDYALFCIHSCIFNYIFSL